MESKKSNILRLLNREVPKPKKNIRDLSDNPKKPLIMPEPQYRFTEKTEIDDKEIIAHYIKVRSIGKSVKSEK